MNPVQTDWNHQSIWNGQFKNIIISVKKIKNSSKQVKRTFFNWLIKCYCNTRTIKHFKDTLNLYFEYNRETVFINVFKYFFLNVSKQKF